MNATFRRLMRQATRLKLPRKLQAATVAIQRALVRSYLPALAPPLVRPAKPAKLPRARPPGPPAAPTAPRAPPGDFAAGSHKHAGLTRSYKLYQGPRSGEAAVIASMTRAVLAAHAVDPARVFIAGLSAGGAMASLVAAANPGLFAAVGVHSGLAPGAAQNLPEGLAAMRGGPAMRTRLAAAPQPTLPAPTIVFHGDRDTTVHPRNGEQVMAAALAGAVQRHGALAGDVVQEGVSARGQRYTRTVYGVAPAVAEHWRLRGAGHAWSGGQAAGSYTDPQGPDASREMLRFFFSQAARTAH